MKVVMTLGIIASVFALFNSGVKNRDSRIDSCDNSGGVLVRTKYTDHCIDKSVFIDT